jgi:hypothetical protein
MLDWEDIALKTSLLLVPLIFQPILLTFDI